MKRWSSSCTRASGLPVSQQNHKMQCRCCLAAFVCGLQSSEIDIDTQSTHPGHAATRVLVLCSAITRERIPAVGRLSMSALPMSALPNFPNTGCECFLVLPSLHRCQFLPHLMVPGTEEHGYPWYDFFIFKHMVLLLAVETCVRELQVHGFGRAGPWWRSSSHYSTYWLR